MKQLTLDGKSIVEDDIKITYGKHHYGYIIIEHNIVHIKHKLDENDMKTKKEDGKTKYEIYNKVMKKWVEV